MNMFAHENRGNLLPYDGISWYYGPVLDSAMANEYFQRLLQHIDWRNDEAVIFGRHIITKRKVAWYGDRHYEYTYSNTTKTAHLWTEDLLALKTIVERVSGCTFNACLLNLYHNGEEGMAWHSDDEKALGLNTAIASLSLGAERKFCFKHKASKETVSVVLEPGSLLVMKDSTQTNWLHSLPKSKKVQAARINLTFRTMVNG